MSFGPFAAEAFKYYERGVNVLPAHPVTKRPCISTWTRWERERQSLRDLDQLRRNHPNAGVGIILGGPDLSLVDIDVDDGERGEADLQGLDLPVPPTAEFTSPGDPSKPKAPGRHLLFEARPAPPTRRLAANVEFRSSGHYVVVPPSLGREWRLGLDHLASLPDEWRAATSSSKALPPGSSGSSRTGLQQVGQLPVLLATDLLTAGESQCLVAAERIPQFLPSAARVLGLPTVELGRSFRCVLHCDDHPSVTLWRRDDGTVHYEDFHTGQTFTLAEVYAARISGQVRHLRGPELAVWKLALLVDAGLVEPAPVEAPPLQGNVLRHVRFVYAGFLHLLSCKWLYSPGAPSPFTWKFAAAWCGVTERQAGEAIRELLRLGMIRIVDTHKSMRLFLPGSRP